MNEEDSLEKLLETFQTGCKGGPLPCGCCSDCGCVEIHMANLGIEGKCPGKSDD